MATLEEANDEKYEEDDNEETEIEELHFVNKRVNEAAENDYSDDEFVAEDETSFKTMVDSRSFRHGLVTVILLVWSALMIPYDIEGGSIHGDYALDRTMFISALYIWLIGHLSCIIACIISLATIKFFQKNQYLQIIQLLLIMTSSCFQVVGAILFAYSFCVNQDDNEGTLWASCVSKSHGLYLLYNSGFITYLGFIVFAEKYQGAIPLISLICDKTCFSDTNDDNPTIKFSKNFRITYLSLIATIGMSLILVFGFDIYGSVGDSYQAIYVGYTFMLIATCLVVISQLLFHCKLCIQCCEKKDKNQIDQELLINNADSVPKRVRYLKRKKKRRGKNLENVFKLISYFLIYAAIVLIFMYSMVSKIPEATIIIERVRLIGNMVIITGTGIQISYELYTRRDDYDKDTIVEHEYKLIPEQDL